MYALGIVVAIIVAWILKRTLLKAPPPPFVMELPPYRMPNFRAVFLNVFQRAGMFVKRAGTVILAISVIMWALANFPKPSAEQVSVSKIQAEIQESCNCPPEEAQKQAETKVQNEALRYSFAGRLGHMIEPVIKPLGYDWKIGVALISSFAAREVFVSTMSILYNVGKDENAESSTLLQAVREAKNENGEKVWSPLLALSTMVFYLLAMQCMSTIAVTRRETNSWSWTLFMVGYMTALAYAGAFFTYQIGKFLGF